ncbi:MAG: glutathione S-transferase family protein [Beijerinckiaceae bacterium]
MKLYDSQIAPNPRRVRIFLAEKGMVCPPRTDIDIRSGVLKDSELAQKNPWHRIPFLELDDGTVISESIAICRYFQELNPQPPLFGEGAFGKAQVEMWNRRIELGLLSFVAAAFRHSHPRMASLEVPQVKEWAVVAAEKAVEEMRRLDRWLVGRSFVAGDTISVADITGGVALDMLGWARIAIPDDCSDLKRWHDSLTTRPSWKA